MTLQMHRRGFLKMVGAWGAGIGMVVSCSSRLFAAGLAKGAPNAEKVGWRLGSAHTRSARVHVSRPSTRPLPWDCATSRPAPRKRLAIGSRGR